MIIIDSREQKGEAMASSLRSLGHAVSITALGNYMDYYLIGAKGTAGVQRKTGSEVFNQVEDIRQRLPEILEVTDTAFLLIEKNYNITPEGWLIRTSSFDEPSITAEQYFGFLQSIRRTGVHVVEVDSLTTTIWWLSAMQKYLEKEHIPKGRAQFTPDQQALGMLCCISGIGETKALTILKEKSIAEVAAMSLEDLERQLTGVGETTARQIFIALHSKIEYPPGRKN